MLKLPVYLDHNATTPCDPRVLEAMLPYFVENFGNAASRNHAYGWQAEEAVKYAREQVAKLIGSEAQEIASAIGDISFRGSIANAVSRKVPSSAAIRGSIPAAFRSGGSRVNVVAAANATNSALDARAAIFKTI